MERGYDRSISLWQPTGFPKNEIIIRSIVLNIFQDKIFRLNAFELLISLERFCKAKNSGLISSVISFQRFDSKN